MDQQRHCSVTILRPYATSYEAFCHDMADDDETHHSTLLDDVVDDIVFRLEDVAERCRVMLNIDEVELRRLESDGARRDPYPLLSRKRSEPVEQSDVLIAIEPPAEVLAYVVNCVQRNPMMRAVLTMLHTERLEALSPVLSCGRTPVMGTRKELRRMYAALFRNDAMLETSVREALIFPNGRQYDNAHSHRSRALQQDVPDRFIDEFVEN